MAKMRKVNVVQGYGKFTGPNSILVEGAKKVKQTTVNFRQRYRSGGFSSYRATVHSARRSTHLGLN